MMPFTAEQFFAVFADYNAAIWPAQWALYALALVAIVYCYAPGRIGDVTITGVLAFLWLWMGLVYHIFFFRIINPAATVFGAAFIMEAVLIGWAGQQRGELMFRPGRDARGVIGGVLIVYALAIYPLLGYVLGHRYPATPTFGAPCPTTIFTFGLLLWMAGRVPVRLLIVPGLWALMGLSAALRLGVPQDLGLFVAGAIAIPLLIFRPRREPGSAPARGPRRVIHAH